MPVRRRLRRVEDSESECTTSMDDDTEGSLADFIEHDSNEPGEEDASYTQSEDASGSDSGSADEMTLTDEDPDEAIRRQYTAEMEMRGSILTDTGVRRSMRTTKGKAPVRYVDEDYAELMLEDISPADQARLAQEFTSSSSSFEDSNDGDFENLGDDDDDALVQ